MLSYFFEVDVELGTRCKTPPENGAPAGETLQRRIIKLCEKTDTIVGWCFCGGDGVERAERPHVALKAFQRTSTRKIRIFECQELSVPKLVC